MLRPFLVVVSLMLATACSTIPKAAPPKMAEVVHIEKEQSKVDPNHRIDWMAPSEKTWTRAEAEDRYVMVVFIQDYCKFCHQLVDMLNTDDDLSEFVNKHFIPVLIENAEEGQVKAITEKDTVAYPTMTFVSPDRLTRLTLEGSAEKYELFKAFATVLEVKAKRDIESRQSAEEQPAKEEMPDDHI